MDATCSTFRRPPGSHLADHRGAFVIANEIDEMRWMNYADRDRVSPLDRLVFDALHRAGRLS